MIALLMLCYWVISKESAVVSQENGFSYKSLGNPSVPTESTGGGYCTVIFAYYCLFIHVLVFAFPLRACWAIWDMTRSLRKPTLSRLPRDCKLVQRRRSSNTSLESSETLVTSPHESATYSEVIDLELGAYVDSDPVIFERVIHAIVIPNYKEEMDTLRETLEVLSSHPQARNSYDVSSPALHFLDMTSRVVAGNWLLPCALGSGIQLHMVLVIVLIGCSDTKTTSPVSYNSPSSPIPRASLANRCPTWQIYLAMEQREDNAELKAMSLISEFVKRFRSIEFTLHPADIPGESAGKGSNMAWAACKLSEKYPLGIRRDVIVTGIDGR